MFLDIGIEFSDDVSHIRFFVFFRIGLVIIIFVVVIMSILCFDNIVFCHVFRIGVINLEIFVFRIEIGEEQSEVDSDILQGIKESISDFALFVHVHLRCFDFDVKTEGCLFDAIMDDEGLRCKEDEVFVFAAVDFD